MDSLPSRITGSSKSSYKNINGGLAQLDSLPRRITGSTIGSNLVSINGGLAQLARALHWQCRGHRFESVILHRAPQHCGALFLSKFFQLCTISTFFLAKRPTDTTSALRMTWPADANTTMPGLPPPPNLEHQIGRSDIPKQSPTDLLR